MGNGFAGAMVSALGAQTLASLGPPKAGNGPRKLTKYEVFDVESKSVVETAYFLHPNPEF